MLLIWRVYTRKDNVHNSFHIISTTESPPIMFLLSSENLLDGLENWLDRLFEGSTHRYYVNYWPDMTTKWALSLAPRLHGNLPSHSPQVSTGILERFGLDPNIRCKYKKNTIWESLPFLVSKKILLWGTLLSVFFNFCVICYIAYYLCNRP